MPVAVKPRVVARRRPPVIKRFLVDEHLDVGARDGPSEKVARLDLGLDGVADTEGPGAPGVVPGHAHEDLELRQLVFLQAKQRRRTDRVTAPGCRERHLVLAQRQRLAQHEFGPGSPERVELEHALVDFAARPADLVPDGLLGGRRVAAAVVRSRSDLPPDGLQRPVGGPVGGRVDGPLPGAAGMTEPAAHRERLPAVDRGCHEIAVIPLAVARARIHREPGQSVVPGLLDGLAAGEAVVPVRVGPQLHARAGHRRAVDRVADVGDHLPAPRLENNREIRDQDQVARGLAVGGRLQQVRSDGQVLIHPDRLAAPGVFARVPGIEPPRLDLPPAGGIQVPDPLVEVALLEGRVDVAGEVHAVQRQVHAAEIAPLHIELDLGAGQEDAGDRDVELRLGDLLDLVLRVVVVAGLALAELPGESPVQLDRLDEVRLLPPLPVSRSDHPAVVGHPLRVVEQRVVVPRAGASERQRRLELRLDPPPLRPRPAVLFQGHRQQVMRAGAIQSVSRDRAGVLQDVQRNVVVIPVVVLTPRGVGHAPHHLQVAAPRRLKVAVPRPPVQRLLVVLPALGPVLRTSAQPPEVAERLVHLGPHPVAVLGPLDRLGQCLQPPARGLKDGVVMGSRPGLGPPRGIGDAELDPTGLRRREIQVAEPLVQLQRTRVRTLRVERLGLVTAPLVLRVRGRGRERRAKNGGHGQETDERA